MKKIAAIVLAFALIGGIVILQSCQSSKSSTASKMLKFNLEKGKGYDYEMISSVDQDMEGRKTTIDMNVYYSMNVIEDDGDQKTIRITYDRFKLLADAGVMKLDVDTDKPLPETNGSDKDPLTMINRMMGAIKGKQFTLLVNNEGKILEVKGLEDMMNSIVDSMGLAGADTAAKEEMKKQFAGRFNNEQVKDQLERVLYILPNKEVKVGDSWERDNSSGIPIKTSNGFKSKYTVTDIEGDMVTLKEESTIKSNEGGTEVSGDMEGTIVVDSRSGLIVNADQEMDFNAKAKGQDVKMKIVSKIKGKAN